LETFFRANDLWGSELTLMDIDEEKLNIIKKIIDRTVKDRRSDLKIAATTNLDYALEDADFVYPLDAEMLQIVKALCRLGKSRKEWKLFRF